ncbi:PorT family protein [Kaistella flava (ex Peng et al. 2021)]|uniref:PorT family protein n=1 Tax=Kaistella flava (ex Peng et al. 2021) TaxID=2038776 RepID=A0A7M2YB61_9FLAO|nr:outer membrane beta-barrel protein [Kaistella flava (ex Peng et al. 2021)]QOW10642.1 PorT family protein [Kaistella flava (ex Peng et al. 2021)]
MKKIITLIAVFLLVTVQAQEFEYGLTGSFHQGSIAGVHDRSTGKFGGTLGVFGQIPLVENDIFDSAWLYINSTIEYSTQGEYARAEVNKFGVQKFNQDYVAMDVVLKYFFHQGNFKKDVFLFAGPRIEYMVRNDRKVDPAYDLKYNKINHDQDVNKFGYGVTLGIGLKVAQQLEAFLKYDHGFSKVYPDNTRNNYNRILGLGLNYYLNEK